jgi:SAM-dependent methyltransferase
LGVSLALSDASVVRREFVPTRLLDRSITLKTAALAASDFERRILFRLGRIHTNSGTAHSTLETSESVEYIEQVVRDYKHYGLIERFHGTAAELGPGDSAGVAILMLDDGCERVDLVDRFESSYDREQQASILRELSMGHEIDRFRCGGGWDPKNIPGVVWHNGRSAEEFFHGCESNSYDFIVSRAVMEHLYDPLGCLENMVRCLRPGGLMLHKIDMRDHGYFSEGNEELTWFRFPSWLWRAMTAHSGRPCRVLIHQYREALERMESHTSLEYRLLVTRLVMVGDVAEHKPFDEIDSTVQRMSIDCVNSQRRTFAPELRAVAAEDLAVAGVFLVVRKTGPELGKAQPSEPEIP